METNPTDRAKWFLETSEAIQREIAMEEAARWKALAWRAIDVIKDLLDARDPPPNYKWENDGDRCLYSAPELAPAPKAEGPPQFFKTGDRVRVSQAGHLYGYTGEVTKGGPIVTVKLDQLPEYSLSVFKPEWLERTSE